MFNSNCGGGFNESKERKDRERDSQRSDAGCADSFDVHIPRNAVIG